MSLQSKLMLELFNWIPPNPNYMLDLAGVYEKAGRMEDAVNQYRAVLRLDPQSVQAGASCLSCLLGGK